MRSAFVLGLGLLILSWAGPGWASAIYHFEAISAADAGNAAAGERQLRMFVRESTSAPDSAELHFSADGFGSASPQEPLSITKIFFEEPAALLDHEAIVAVAPTLDDSIRFVRDPDPPTLVQDHSFSAAGPEGAVHHGIQPGEPQLMVVAPLQPLTVNGVTGIDLLLALLDRDRVIGNMEVELTVEGFEGGGTETFRQVASPVPEPGTAALAALAAGALALRSRWRSEPRAQR